MLLHWPFANYYTAWRSLEELYTDERIWLDKKTALIGNPETPELVEF